MRYGITTALFLLLVLTTSEFASGHGTPIELDVVDEVLTVGHPDDGYAPLVFGQLNEESDPQGPLNHPVLGRTLLWGLPGIDIAGMADSASLSIEVLAPIGVDGSPETLWYWRAQTGEIESLGNESELRLLLADGSFVALHGADITAPSSATLASTVAGQTGYHNHGLVNFAMPYDPESLQTGLYGFFSRFTSNTYVASDWFLTVFNVGATYGDMSPASEAMWGAAFPGDYDRNGTLDANDASAWAATYGSQPPLKYGGADGNGDGIINAVDYSLWRDQVASTVTLIPEPITAVLVALAVVGVGSRRALHG